jgi:hypothetical protein
MNGDSTAETPYIETEMLLAVMNDDTTRLLNLLQGMSPTEIRIFLDQVRSLEQWLSGEIRAWKVR